MANALSSPAAAFAGSFLQGLTQSRNKRFENELAEKLLDTRISLQKKQLEQKERQDAAIQSLVERLTGTAQPGEEMGAVTQPTGTQGQSLTQLMSDPEAIALMLQGGAATIPQLMQGQQQAETLAQSRELFGRFGPGGGAPGAGTGGLMPEDVVFTPGKPPAFKFARTGPGAPVKFRHLDPENPTQVVEKDQFGNTVNVRPAGLDELQELDKPLGKDAKSWTNKAGQSADAQLTVREAIAKGFKPGDKTQMSDASRVAIMESGIQSIETMKDMLFPKGKPIDNARLAKILFQATAPGGGIGEGRRYNTLSYPAVAGQILLLSGVAVRPEERAQLMSAYIPSVGDLTSPGLVQEKLDRFRELLEGNLDAVMSSLPISLQERIQQIKAQGGGKPTRQSGRTIDFSELPK